MIATKSLGVLTGLLWLLLWPAHAVAQQADWERYRDAARAAIQQGNYAEAVKQVKAALSAAETFGPNDPRLAETLDTLAFLYAAQGKYAEAEPLYKRALAIREKVLGPDHLKLAFTLTGYAAVLRKTGRATEAAKLEARAKAIAAKPFGVTFRITRCKPKERQIHETHRVIEGDVPRGIDLTDETVVRKLLSHAENVVWSQCPALAHIRRPYQGKPYLADVEVKLFQAGEQLVTARSSYYGFRKEPYWQQYKNLAVWRKKKAEEAEQRRQAELAQQARQKQARLEAERAQKEARAEFVRWYANHEKVLIKSPYGQVGAVKHFLAGLRDKNFHKLFETEDNFRRVVIRLREHNPTTLWKKAIFDYYWRQKTHYESLLKAGPGTGAYGPSLQERISRERYVYGIMARYVPPPTTWNVVETRRVVIPEVILERPASRGLAVYVKLSYANPGSAAKLRGKKLREAMFKFLVNDAGYIVDSEPLGAGFVYWAN
ncbi:MAG: tetratricopeptide repeat protein [Planctomycetota bacterium]